MQIPNREEAAMFGKGERVLCVAKGWIKPTGEVNECGPRHGAICVVACMASSPCGCGRGADALYIEGFAGHYFCCDGFRPLKKTQTDISVFTEILTKCPAPGRPVYPVRMPADFKLTD
jgi:hypothetical protein